MTSSPSHACHSSTSYGAAPRAGRNETNGRRRTNSLTAVSELKSPHPRIAAKRRTRHRWRRRNSAATAMLSSSERSAARERTTRADSGFGVPGLARRLLIPDDHFPAARIGRQHRRDRLRRFPLFRSSSFSLATSFRGKDSPAKARATSVPARTPLAALPRCWRVSDVASASSCRSACALAPSGRSAWGMPLATLTPPRPPTRPDESPATTATTQRRPGAGGSRTGRRPMCRGTRTARPRPLRGQSSCLRRASS